MEKCNSQKCEGTCKESIAFSAMTREQWVAYALAQYGQAGN